MRGICSINTAVLICSINKKPTDHPHIAIQNVPGSEKHPNIPVDQSPPISDL